VWEFVGQANRFVDSEQPWALAKAAAGGDGAASDRLAGTLGDLLEACRLIALAAAPFVPRTAPRALAQLGLEFAYAANGSDGPPLAEHAAWGAGPAGGVLGEQQILFPRIDETTTD
jgi:methionyl-tRNA synthetase